MTFHDNMQSQAAYFAAPRSMYEAMSPLSGVASPSPDSPYQTAVSPIPLAQPNLYPLGVGDLSGAPTPVPTSISPEEQVQIEFTDLSAPYPEDLNYKPRRQDGNRQPSNSMHMRRRAQNRASQRAFRERKEKHTADLQRRLTDMEEQYEQLKQNFDVVHLEKCQLEEATRRCSCGGSVVASPASAADSSLSDCGDLSGIDVGAVNLLGHAGLATRDAGAVDPVYEVVDWEAAGR